MKVSEVTNDFVTDYLRLDEPSTTEASEISMIMTSALEYIKAYTGLTDDEIDTHADITDAYLVIIADFFDNRNYMIEKVNYANRVVDTILNLHVVNLL